MIVSSLEDTATHGPIIPSATRGEKPLDLVLAGGRVQLQTFGFSGQPNQCIMGSNQTGALLGVKAGPASGELWSARSLYEERQYVPTHRQE